MNFLDALFLGVLEGATEFLPVSSTGHLILAQHALHILETPFTTSFLIAIQVGAIAAVAVMYWKRFFDIRLLIRLFIAFLPTGILGLTLYKIIKEYLLSSEWVVVGALFVGGLFLIGLERWHRERPDATGDLNAITYRQAFAIGLCQSVAMIPGVSRSGATIAGGLMLGLKRATIVEFSFLLAVPTMVAATGYDLLKSYHSFSTGNISTLLVGVITAFIVALFSLRFFIRYVKTHTFVPFAVYRIAIAFVFAIALLYA